MTKSFPSASPDRSSTSTNLVRQVQANQADAWARLVDLYGPLVWHWCRQSDLSQEDQADVFQQVFQSVIRKIGEFQRSPARGSFRGWLLTITQNHVRDHFRRQSRHPAAAGGSEAHRRLLALQDPDAEDSSTSTGVHPVTRLLHQTLQAIRPDFEPRTWQAFWRTTVDGQSSSAVAKETGMTSGAVRKAKARVLTRLRCELGDQV